MAPAARGRGLASAALGLLADWGFMELGLQRLAIQVEAENIASQRLAQRCGFVLEGRRRLDQRLRDGTRADVLVYGLLPGELASGPYRCGRARPGAPPIPGPG